MLLFLWFHNDTSVVWISKTVSIDANYLLKLETFLIHFDEGKGTCIRSSEGDQLFPGRKEEKKNHGEKSGIYQNCFFVPCHAIKLKITGMNRLKAKKHREYLYQPGKVFLSESINLHWIGDRPNFGQNLMGCSLRGQFCSLS